MPIAVIAGGSGFVGGALGEALTPRAAPDPLLEAGRVGGVMHIALHWIATGHAARLEEVTEAALALCLADSLDAVQRCDARDQIERYWRWFRQGEHAALGTPGADAASPDVARALATYRWRGQPVGAQGWCPWRDGRGGRVRGRWRPAPRTPGR